MAPYGVRSPLFARLRSFESDRVIALHSKGGLRLGAESEHWLTCIDCASPVERLALLRGLHQRLQIALHRLQLGTVSRPVALLEVLLRPLVMLEG